ncbi:methyl-accepting chemotaxis protein [Peptococcaceae bacterium 1198_IL3148]
MFRSLLSGLKIKSSLIAFVVLLVCCLGTLGIYNYKELHAVQENITSLEREITVSVLQAKDMRYSVIQVQQWLTDASATGDIGGLTEAEKYAQQFRTYAKGLQDSNLGDSSEINEILKDFEPYYAIGIKMANAYISQGREAGNAIMPEFDSAAELLSNNLDKYVDNHVQEMSNTLNNTQIQLQIIVSRLVLVLGLIAFTLIGGCLLLFYKIVPPLKLLMDSMNDINQGEGDLTRRIPAEGKDEISDVANSFNGIIENLHEIISNIKTNSENLTSYSQDLASASEEVNTSMEEVAGITNEVAATSKQGTENLTAMAHDSRQMYLLAEEGNKAVKETVEKINSIARVSGNTANVIKALGEQSQQIGRIITVITNISEQTNLLALNAAIESARAGEHGRGFAVVAEEVRKLAEQSADASSEITRLIEQMQAGVEKAVASIEGSVVEVGEGVQIANNAGISLEKITRAAKTNTNIIQDVASGVVQVNEGMQQLAQSSEQITSSTLQVSSASQQLANIADKLSKTVDKFKLQ